MWEDISHNKWVSDYILIRMSVKKSSAKLSVSLVNSQVFEPHLWPFSMIYLIIYMAHIVKLMYALKLSWLIQCKCNDWCSAIVIMKKKWNCDFSRKHPNLFCLYLSNQILLRGRFVFKSPHIKTITVVFTSWGKMTTRMLYSGK